MAESVPPAPDNDVTETNAKVPLKHPCGDSGIPANYPYRQILRTLQDGASPRDPAVAADASDGQRDPPLTNVNAHCETWDLSTDALLATLLHEFSSHVASRAYHTASDIRRVQDAVNHAGVDVAVCQTELMTRSADVFMEQVVGDDDSESGTDEEEAAAGCDGDSAGESLEPKEEQSQSDQPDDDSTAEIARLEAEEKAAIHDGMKALSIFFDPKRPNKSSGSSSSGEGDVVIDAEEDIIGENCYYYLSADEDGFNQRPLPFIVGSREFMESSYAGMGADGGENKYGEGEDRGTL